MVGLASDAIRGSRSALERLMSLLYPIVRRSLSARLRHRSPEDVDDLTQTTMARVAERLPQCVAASDPQLVAWVRAIAWRVALEELRTPAARIARVSRSIDDAARSPRSPGRQLTSEVHPVDHYDADRDDDTGASVMARAAARALDAMPSSTGLLFWMRLVDGASWPEIAQALGTTTAGVKRRFERACARLRSVLCKMR